MKEYGLIVIGSGSAMNIVDAFIHLKQGEQFKDLKLHLTGGYSGDASEG